MLSSENILKIIYIVKYIVVDKLVLALYCKKRLQGRIGAVVFPDKYKIATI